MSKGCMRYVVCRAERRSADHSTVRPNSCERARGYGRTVRRVQGMARRLLSCRLRKRGAGFGASHATNRSARRSKSASRSPQLRGAGDEVRWLRAFRAPAAPNTSEPRCGRLRVSPRGVECGLIASARALIGEVALDLDAPLTTVREPVSPRHADRRFVPTGAPRDEDHMLLVWSEDPVEQPLAERQPDALGGCLDDDLVSKFHAPRSILALRRPRFPRREAPHVARAPRVHRCRSGRAPRCRRAQAPTRPHRRGRS